MGVDFAKQGTEWHRYITFSSTLYGKSACLTFSMNAHCFGHPPPFIKLTDSCYSICKSQNLPSLLKSSITKTVLSNTCLITNFRHIRVTYLFYVISSPYHMQCVVLMHAEREWWGPCQRRKIAPLPLPDDSGFRVSLEDAAQGHAIVLLDIWHGDWVGHNAGSNCIRRWREGKKDGQWDIRPLSLNYSGTSK